MCTRADGLSFWTRDSRFDLQLAHLDRFRSYTQDLVILSEWLQPICCGGDERELSYCCGVDVAKRRGSIRYHIGRHLATTPTRTACSLKCTAIIASFDIVLERTHMDNPSGTSGMKPVTEMPTQTVRRRDVASTSTTSPNRTVASIQAASSAVKPTRPAALERLQSGGNAASILQSSAVAAMGSMRTLSSISSSETSLHRILPKRTLKIVLIGDGGCGKTSIRNHFLSNTFFPSYRATIGADFITKTLPIDPSKPEGEKATLQIWDTAGQERFQSLGSAFYRGADAVIIAFDVTKGDQALERVKMWYNAFMQKAPGPETDEQRKRFVWICAANKVDLIQEGVVQGVERDKVWSLLDGLEQRKEGQKDWGDVVETAEVPSGAEEPANPHEVLSRPDPNGAQQVTTPGSSRIAKVEMAGAKGEPTPISLKKLGYLANGDSSPTPVPARQRTSDYRLSRKSLSSIAAAAARSAQAKADSDADDATADQNSGTVNTVYATPYNTMTHAATLTASPAAESDLVFGPPLAEGVSAGIGSGFLSGWMRTKSKASGQSGSGTPRGRGHAKRQSIKSIEVFQTSDQEESDHVSDSSTGGARSGKVAFPGSCSTRVARSKSRVQETPPRSIRGTVVEAKDRQRVDSTMSLNAPSVYHTPRGSTFFSVSPTPRTTLGIGASEGKQSQSRGDADDDGSVKRLSVGSFNSSVLAGDAPGLRYRPSLASSTLSVATTIKPTASRRPHPPQISTAATHTLKAPKSINDLFQPQSPISPSPPHTPSTISLPIEPVAPLPAPLPDLQEPEHGFTLFYTSAKTGNNIERMFRHILHRIVSTSTYMDAQQCAAANAHSCEDRHDRQHLEAEIMRRTIRLASGKNPNDRWFTCC